MARSTPRPKRPSPGAPPYDRRPRWFHFLAASAIAAGSSACGLTADWSGIQGGDAAAADGGAPQSDASSVPEADGADDSSASGGDCPTLVPNCPIQVTKDTFDTSYDGKITYLNTGQGDEINPTLEFTVPSGVTLFTSGCIFSDQIVPSGITAVSCSQSGTTISYAFTGTMPANGVIAIYYTTSMMTETVATCIAVTAESCM